jgi:5-methylcytosine-specific restriction enzyme subunit McrC
MQTQINLFEFVKYSFESSEELKPVKEYKKDFSDDLESVLDKIWGERNKYIPAENLYYKSTSKKQRFIDFRKDSISPRNWIGTIHFRGSDTEYTVNLLPKVFYNSNKKNYTSEETDIIFAHILWWLSGSEKQNYSSMESSLGALESNFLEVLVYIFSSYTLDVLSSTSYNYYESVEEELQTVKGQIDFNGYMKNYAIGNRHILPCKFDSFQYDNQFNKIVKYVSSILKDFTKNKKTKSNLEEIIFILDEVEHISVTVEDCDKVILNPIYSEFKTILDNCRLFLSSLSVYKWKDDYSVFALLIPSEKLFENFIFGFLNESKNLISDNIEKVYRQSNVGRSHIAYEKNKPDNWHFKMYNDIIVKLNNLPSVIIDTKYKVIYKDNEADEEEVTISNKNNYTIKQSDIYQMSTYALTSGILKIGLWYPSTLGDSNDEVFPKLVIKEEFSGNHKEIEIHIAKLNIIHEKGLKMNVNGTLETIFQNTKNKLIAQISQVLAELK